VLCRQCRGVGVDRTGRETRSRRLNADAHLDDLVPTSRDDDGVGRVGRESNARNPTRITQSPTITSSISFCVLSSDLHGPTRDSPLRVTLLLDIKLALSQSVPKLDGLVPGGRDDLPVVGRERDREDVVGVTDESTGGRSRVEVPQSEGVVPRRGEGELTWTSGSVDS
jgi:hypothetical protein